MMDKRCINRREHRLAELTKENKELREELNQYVNGYQGACYACEPVGMLNQRLSEENGRLRELLKDAEASLDPYTDTPLVMELRAVLEEKNAEV